MPYSLRIAEPCEEDIRKLAHKNKPMQDALHSKIQKILENPHMFKPLRKPMQGTHRVHILGSFVLIYVILETEHEVKLLRLMHHDNAYK